MVLVISTEVIKAGDKNSWWWYLKLSSGFVHTEFKYAIPRSARHQELSYEMEEGQGYCSVRKAGEAIWGRQEELEYWKRGRSRRMVRSGLTSRTRNQWNG